MLRAAREASAFGGVSGKAAIARPLESAGIRDVGNDRDDPGVGDASRVDRIRDRLEVGAAAGEQDREAPRDRELGFQGPESTPRGVERVDKIRSKTSSTGKERPCPSSGPSSSV